MRSSFSLSLLYHAYVYLEFLILACTIYILAPILLGIGVALFADYQFVQNISGVMRTIGMVLLGMIVLVYIYEVVFVFPLIARFDNTMINMLKNAVLIPISRLPYAVFVLGLSGMCVCV